VLRNESVVCRKDGRKFYVAGVDSDVEDPSINGGRPPQDADRALAGCGEDAPVILLAHEPDIFARLAPRVGVQLSGHMHAGQVRFGRMTPAALPSRYGTRYLHGLIEEQGTPLIVSAGLGYSRLPVRIGAPPEIVLVEAQI
jgi:predicted MPP superfamily phosphohydrolase